MGDDVEQRKNFIVTNAREVRKPRLLITKTAPTGQQRRRETVSRTARIRGIRLKANKVK